MPLVQLLLVDLLAQLPDLLLTAMQLVTLQMVRQVLVHLLVLAHIRLQIVLPRGQPMVFQQHTHLQMHR